MWHCELLYQHALVLHSIFKCASPAGAPMQVAQYVKERVLALRREHPGQYGNIACVRTNTQKYLTNYFRKGSSPSSSSCSRCALCQRPRLLSLNRANW